MSASPVYTAAAREHAVLCAMPLEFFLRAFLPAPFPIPLLKMKFTFDNWFAQGTIYLFEEPPQEFLDRIAGRHTPAKGPEKSESTASPNEELQSVVTHPPAGMTASNEPKISKS